MKKNRDLEETILNAAELQDGVKKHPVETLESTSKTWKKVVISGISGIVLGATSSYTAAAHAFNKTLDEVDEEEKENTAVSDSAESPVTEPTFTETVSATDNVIVSVAVVDDSLSFGEVFAAARQQVGAGGIFEWRGNVYGTYYETEWDAMSDAEKQEWQRRALNTTVGENEQQAIATQEEENPLLIATSEEVQADDEVKFLGMGEVENENGSVMTIAGLEMGGQNVVLLDVDNDGTFDIAAADKNANGYIDDNEYFEIDNPTMTTENYQVAMDAQMGVASNNYLADMPDYVNDADGLYDA